MAAPQLASMRKTIETLEQRYAAQKPVSVFYQVWDQPLITLNGDHSVSHAFELCGGINVFAALSWNARHPPNTPAMTESALRFQSIQLPYRYAVQVHAPVQPAGRQALDRPADAVQLDASQQKYPIR